MLKSLKKIFKTLDDASKRAETKCNACGHVMQGPCDSCEKCGMPITMAKD